MLSKSERRELIELAEQRKKRQSFRRLFNFTPYPKQLEFYADGAEHRERLLMAANQVGKTLSMGFEVAMHLTGRYPGAGEVFYPDETRLAEMALTEPRAATALYENLAQLGLLGKDVYPNGWPGYRFDGPNWWWCSSVSGEATRDNPQRILVGPPSLKEQWGSGAIPREDLLFGDKMSYAMRQGTSDALDHILVKHVFGGTSICQFKTYEQGRQKWQGPTLGGVWFDEEPPKDIYEEGLTRTNTTQGPVGVTFTPLLGMSEVVRLFIGSPDELTETENAA